MEFKENREFSAFKLACRQLEITGFCPHAPKNDLTERFHTCPRAKAGGVGACHNCIKEFMEAEYEKRTNPDKRKAR